MTKLRPFAAAFLVAAAVVCFSISVAGQTSDGNLASVAGGGSSAKWEITASKAGGTLTINFPDGRSMRKTFRAGESPQVTIGEKYFDGLPDGFYSYELQLAAPRSEAAIKARGKDDDPESVRAGRKRVSVTSLTQSGSFSVVNGAIVLPGGIEPEQKRRTTGSTGPAAAPATRATASANVLQRIRNNHRAFFMPDDVVPDDQIVQGSECVGLDCVNGEAFSFDTIRLKENNTRILFLDTSTSQGFPTNDWILKANDSGGGSSYFGIVDHGNAGTGAETGTIIAQFDAGASANSIRVSSTGRVGLKTATPVLALHINESDTPDMRLEQNNSGGFPAQTWDIAGNEANFFVRDVTGGSLLPFRIRPGAPTSSVDISATGSVGVGTASPDGLQVNVAATETARTVDNIRLGVVAGTPRIILEDSASATLQQIDNFAGALRFFRPGAVSMVIDTSGNVGINTSAPTDNLSVNGTASKPGGGSWAVFSDERLKNIKGRFNTGLSAVMRLQPLRYQYKADNPLQLKSTGENIGFGAGELQKIIPEAVTRSENGYLMVNNDPILWTMLNAIKEQQQQIAELKAEVQKLRTATRRRRR